MTAPHTRNEVYDFLGTPLAYDLPASRKVRRMDTHISAIFLIGDTVYKVKKAVAFPFLDHTDLATRKAVCLREVELNAPWAPGLYQGVVAVTRDTAGRLELGGDGEPVEWVVVMRRFRQDALFSHIVENERPSRQVVLDLAELLVRYHDSAPRVDNREDWAFRTVENSLQSLAPFRMDLGEAACARLEAGLRAALETHRDLLGRRAAEGFVRRCHGDLHLGNIVMWQDRLRPFDAIDFNDMFSDIDVLYDLAFLLMDLDERGHRRLASYILNHTLEYTGDMEGLALLPLFLSLRSTIRAFVNAATAASLEDPAARAEKLREAEKYLHAAIQYLLPHPARVVAVGGLSGSGKSHLARKLAGELPWGVGAVVVRSDVVRKRLCDVSPYEKLPPEAYTPDMARRTYEAVLAEGAQALDAGASVVFDSVFSRPDERAEPEALARQKGVPFVGIWAHSDTRTALRRVSTRTHNASDADAEVRLKQETYDLGDITWARVDTSGSRKKSLQQALHILRGRKTG
ncbi:AAA family ATPase [Phaeovibrio sulfidiphilus]|uniref:AAA family ATPase n=1 Tax=Phaeovibrio sulfidiphilus TaxID=1220600 RepID=A0A8J6YY68_9PROT|nr:bifunctional aminoglycoside phosphotransferase/ATP-binding protein [Phaeovibrio sulfidiphilus]MBE1236698.1 AAA family ATPase [Phaeovibrio sulfidiphilus]